MGLKSISNLVIKVQAEKRELKQNNTNSREVSQVFLRGLKNILLFEKIAPKGYPDQK